MIPYQNMFDYHWYDEFPHLFSLQMLGLFPSSNAIAHGDKEYHSAVNIGASMKARYNNWRHQGW
jgi:hypothetical protein